MEAQPERRLSEIDTDQVLANLTESLNNGEVPSALGSHALRPTDPNARLVYSTDKKIPMTAGYATELTDVARAPGLNIEETQMLALLARGFSVEEIAESRGMSEGFATQLLDIAADKASDNEWVKRNLFGDGKEKEKATRSYGPQEQVVNWMHSLRARATTVSELDLRFTMGTLPNWRLHRESVDGAGLSWFVRPISEDTDREALEKAQMISKKDGVYVYSGEDRVEVEIQAYKLLPVHLARIALVDLACATKDGNLTPVLGKFDSYGMEPVFSKSSRYVDRRPSIAINKLLGVGEEYRNGVVITDKQIDLLGELTPIEATVLSHSHMSNEQIAEKLSVEQSTLRTHLHNIYNKYGSKMSPKETLFTAIGGDLLRLAPLQKQEIKAKYTDNTPLSPTEDIVFCLQANGYSYDEIASKLGKSKATVRTQIHNVYVKLGGSHLRENVLIAHLNGIDLSEPKITSGSTK